MMRKPRDPSAPLGRAFDSELKALADKARQLKQRRLRQLGELVIACGADGLNADLLAGALLDAATIKDGPMKEGWRRRGAAFFQRKASAPAKGPASGAVGGLPLDGGAASA